MRKYRGLTKEGKWVYGWYLHRHESDWDGHDKYIHQIHTAEWNEFIEVIPETVGQFTGLKDKNVTEIYEGDIVIIGCYHLRAVIEYEHCGFVMHHVKGSKRRKYCANSRCEPIFLNCNISVEVIGNIHQNPELLEQE